MRISYWSSVVCLSDLLAAAERAGIVNLLGHEFSWVPDRALLAQAIREGRICTPRFVSVLSYLPLLADPAAPMPDWWFDTDRGGGWLGAHSSHIIDQVRDWLGEFKTLSASQIGRAACRERVCKSG